MNKKIFVKFQKKNFYNRGRFIYQNAQNQILRNFRNLCWCSQRCLIVIKIIRLRLRLYELIYEHRVPDLSKKVIRENPYFLKYSKILGLKKKTKRYERKVRLNYSRFFFTLKKILVFHIFLL